MINNLSIVVLKQYGMDGELSEVSNTSSRIYQLQHGNNRYVVKLHKLVDFSLSYDLSIYLQGEKLEKLLETEMKLLAYLYSNAADIVVQKPVLNKSNSYVTYLNEFTFITITTWIDGFRITPADLNRSIAYQLGETIAKLHSQIRMPEGYALQDRREFVNRPRYAEKFIESVQTEINIWHSKEFLTAHQFGKFTQIVEKVSELIMKYSFKKEYIVFVHMDLALSNLILHNGEIIPIDYSLSGIGLLYFDLASIFSQISNVEYRDEIIRGYENTSKLSLDRNYIKNFMDLGEVLYVLTRR